jgi:hypothetical protein
LALGNTCGICDDLSPWVQWSLRKNHSRIHLYILIHWL